MSLKNRAQLRQEVAENLGILDTDSNEAFDATTTPSLTRVNQYIDDALREITSNYPYDVMERNCLLPFYHTINNVPSATLVDVSGLSSTVTPYPDTTALETMCVTLDPSQASLSGVSFTGPSGVTTSVSGTQTTANYNTVGYMYEMPEKVDKVIAITIPTKGIKCSYVPYYDFLRQTPQGLNTSSTGTPSMYTLQNGMSASGNTMLQFYPAPDTTLSGTNFQVHYKSKETGLTSDTDVPEVVPDNYQDIIVSAVLEKSYILVSDIEKATIQSSQKTRRLMDLRRWCENNPDFVNRFRDGHYLSSGGISTGADLAVGYMVNGYR